MELSEEKLEQYEGLDEESLGLLKAADLIEKHGHCKYVLRDKQGRFCIWGALIFVGVPCFSVEKRLQKYLGRDSITWNNAPERTAEEVVSTLRRVALGG